MNSPGMPVRYAELHALSNFTFLRGASHPEELVLMAGRLGYVAIAITDECSVSGIVRAHAAANECGIKLIVGTEVQLTGGPKLVLLARNRNGYARMCRLITDGRRAADKGQYRLDRHAFDDGLPDCLVLLVPNDRLSLDTGDRWVLDAFRDRLWMCTCIVANAAPCRTRSPPFATA